MELCSGSEAGSYLRLIDTRGGGGQTSEQAQLLQRLVPRLLQELEDEPDLKCAAVPRRARI